MTEFLLTDLDDEPDRITASAGWFTSAKGPRGRSGAGGSGRRFPAPAVGTGSPAGAARARSARAHAERLGVAGDRIVSGRRSAALQHRDGSLLLGSGPDHDLWLVLARGDARLRGHEALPEHGLPARIEPNGLIRVLDRRVPLRAVLRLARDLGATPETSEATHPALAQRIPAGRYGRVDVRHDLDDYRVDVAGAAAHAFRHLTFETLGPGRLLVPGVQEGALRRALVAHMMPVHHRLLLAASLHGRIGSRTVRRIAVLPHVRRTRE